MGDPSHLAIYRFSWMPHSHLARQARGRKAGPPTHWGREARPALSDMTLTKFVARCRTLQKGNRTWISVHLQEPALREREYVTKSLRLSSLARSRIGWKLHVCERICDPPARLSVTPTLRQFRIYEALWYQEPGGRTRRSVYRSKMQPWGKD